jgi:geranylgeranyl diphosphate synthase, type II
MQTLSQISQSFGNYITKQTFEKEPIALYEPITYILSLGGKRIRPILSVAAYQLFADRVEEVYPVAFTVELFHNFTLMHDDIMDDAPLRRGKATVHTKYNVNTGILSGDAMLILAYEYLTSVSADIKTVTKLIKVFNKVALEVCEGQQFDINFEKINKVTISEYLRMIELKTAVLLAAALEMGAIVANASESDTENIYEFGRNIGIAFQLQDDILDTYGDSATFGKKVGGDIAQNKKTYLYLKSLELLSETDAQQLFDCYNTSDIAEKEKIEKVKTLFDKAQIRSHAETLQQEYYEKAMSHLNAIPVAEELKQPLYQIASELMIRKV